MWQGYGGAVIAIGRYLDNNDKMDGLLEWEQVYNTVRLHQARGYMTPLKFMEQWKENQRKGAMCH